MQRFDELIDELESKPNYTQIFTLDKILIFLCVAKIRIPLLSCAPEDLLLEKKNSNYLFYMCNFKLFFVNCIF